MMRAPPVAPPLPRPPPPPPMVLPPPSQGPTPQLASQPIQHMTAAPQVGSQGSLQFGLSYSVVGFDLPSGIYI